MRSAAFSLGFLGLAVGSLLILPTPAEATIYGVSWDGGFYAINENSGSGTLVGSTGYSELNSMAIDSLGTLYSSAARLITLDPGTGAGTGGPVVNPVLDIRGLAFSPDGILYAIDDGKAQGTTEVPDDLYTINVATGAASLVGSTSYYGLQALAFDAAGTLYGWEVGTGAGFGVGLVTINPNTGAATDVNPSVGGSGGDVQALEFGPDGTLYGARHSLYAVDLDTGVLTLVGSGDYSDIRGIAFVPEPGTLVLLGTAALGLLAYAWPRHRA